MAERNFSNAVVIGSGMMGPGIALTLALGGLKAAILSRTAEGAAAGLERARAQARLLADKDLVLADRAEAAIGRLCALTSFEEAVRSADLVVESAPEKMEFKQDLFARLDATARPDAVLASNTSGLSITAIASKCKHPERVVTTHFWNPPHLMPLVEVVKGEHTSDEVAQAMFDLFTACGKKPVIVKKDRPGQLGNRLQMALVREAVNIVAEGIADADAVDTVAKNGFGLRMPVYGIFEHQDIVGLDLGIAVLEYVAADLYSERHAPPYMHELMRLGQLGARAGKGFYDWSDKSADEVRARRDAFLVEVLRYRKAKGAGA